MLVWHPGHFLLILIQIKTRAFGTWKIIMMMITHKHKSPDIIPLTFINISFQGKSYLADPAKMRMVIICSLYFSLGNLRIWQERKGNFAGTKVIKEFTLSFAADYSLTRYVRSWIDKSLPFHMESSWIFIIPLLLSAVWG